MFVPIYGAALIYSIRCLWSGHTWTYYMNSMCGQKYYLPQVEYEVRTERALNVDFSYIYRTLRSSPKAHFIAKVPSDIRAGLEMATISGVYYTNIKIS